MLSVHRAGPFEIIKTYCVFEIFEKESFTSLYAGGLAVALQSVFRLRFFPKPPSRCWVVFALESLKGNLSFFGVLFCLEGVGLGWIVFGLAWLGSFLAWLGLAWLGSFLAWLGLAWLGSFLAGLGWIVLGLTKGWRKKKLKQFLRLRRA